MANLKTLLTDLYNKAAAYDALNTLVGQNGEKIATNIAKLNTVDGQITDLNSRLETIESENLTNELSQNYATSSDTNDDLALAGGDTFEEAFGKLENIPEQVSKDLLNLIVISFIPSFNKL